MHDDAEECHGQAIALDWKQDSCDHHQLNPKQQKAQQPFLNSSPRKHLQNSLIDSILRWVIEPFGIEKYCTDGWGAYERYLLPEKHEFGKRKTPRIEQKHLRLRTRIKRLARKTICFSKSEEMHDLVIGIFINRYEFGLNV